MESLLIDPEIRQRQLEWVEELEVIDKSQYISKGSDILAGVSDKFGLTAVWLADALYARSLDYPQTDFELLCYRIVRSRFLKLMFNIAVAAQIFIPFFAPSGCKYAEKLSTVSKFIAVDVICLVVYCVDLFLSLYINHKKKRLIHKPWTAFRLFCCIFLFLDIIAYSNYDFNAIRLVRSIFPFILISRRTNLQKMFQGIFVSCIRSLSVVLALISILILWTFVGFLLFRNVSTDANSNRFDTLPDALFATLHCITSRPFCVLELNPFFLASQASAVFFVTLTLASDVICISLIVAIGTSEYKLFATRMVKRRLWCRYYGLRAVFDALAIENRLSRECWILLCERLRYGFHRSSGEAAILYSMECNSESDQIDFESYLRLCALLSARVSVVVPTAKLTDIERSISLAQSDISTIIAQSSIKITSEIAGVNSAGGCGVDWTSVGDKLDESIGFRLSISDKENPTDTAMKKINGKPRDKSSLYETLTKTYQWFRLVCYRCATAYMVVELPANYLPLHVALRSVLSVINHFFLLIYLYYVSSGFASKSWYRFGDAIEFFFCADLFIRVVGFGFTEALKTNYTKAELLINITSIISLCILGQNHRGSKDGALIATLIIQSARFFGLFFVVNDVDIFEMMYPILIRAGFIFFSVIYFFAIFAHAFFCDSLSVSAASGGDDDSSQWVQYADQLNFSSYLISMYTLFEIAILANWSIVMDAAARVAGTGSYVFFYSFRLMVTLFVLPLLTGFIMQAFLAARRKKAWMVEEERAKQQAVDAQNGSVVSLSILGLSLKRLSNAALHQNSTFGSENPLNSQTSTTNSTDTTGSASGSGSGSG